MAEDAEQSTVALRQMAAPGAGPRAAQALSEIVPQLLARDAATIESEAAAIVPQLGKLRAGEIELDALRTASLQSIEQLTPDAKSLADARRNYARLSNTMARLTPIYARQMRVSAALARRMLCLELLPKSRPAGDFARISKLAEQALAMPADAARSITDDPLNPPAEATPRRLAFYVASRRIDGWNRQMESAMNAAEIAHARRVNAYRELLGMMPYEWDVRLIQSARRHSKEMMDLWYFGHYSPTDTERSPGGRMIRAGYAAGSNENITMGSWTGDDAFWQFFNSPDHHRAWLDRDATALGIGKWEYAWTEDIGSGPRLMIRSSTERDKATIVGPELKPQAREETRQRPRDMSNVKFYDESGQEVKSIPGIERKISVK
jgi:uncharacterized protein YkwD